MQTYAEAKLSDREGRRLWLVLSEEVHRDGLTAPVTLRVLLRLGALAFVFAAALWLSWFGNSWVALAAAYAALALLIAQFAFVGHDAGHGAISRRPLVNRIIGQASMTLVTGLAFDEWIGRHRAHHRYCQDEGRDPDMAVDLVVSLTERSRQAKGALGRFLTRTQATHLWPLSLLFGHSQRMLSQAAVLAAPRRYRLDAVMLLAHFALWFGLPCALLGVSVSSAVLAYLVPLTLLGPYLAAIFWVNHVGMPLVRRVEDFSFFEHQVITSRNVSHPRGWNWLFGGLNYQIEHHLFPQLPSARLPALQVIVRAHFERHGIAYRSQSWWSALRAVHAHLRAIARSGASAATAPPAYGWRQRLLELASIALFAVLAAGSLWRLGVESGFGLALVLLGAVPCGWVAADLLSGLLHFAFDRLGSATTPVIGRAFIRPFREHHVDPAAMTRHDFVETHGASCLAALPFLAAACALPFETVPVFAQAVLLCTALGALVTNQCHKWAHMDEAATPRIVRLAQRWRIALPREHHQRHHRPPFDSHFCMSCGWMNAPLDLLLRVWR